MRTWEENQPREEPVSSRGEEFRRISGRGSRPNTAEWKEVVCRCLVCELQWLISLLYHAFDPRSSTFDRLTTHFSFIHNNHSQKSVRPSLDGGRRQPRAGRARISLLQLLLLPLAVLHKQRNELSQFGRLARRLLLPQSLESLRRARSTGTMPSSKVLSGNVRACGSAPASRSIATTGRLPFSAALCSGVHSSCSAQALTSAPWSMSSRTIGSPSQAARNSASRPLRTP